MRLNKLSESTYLKIFKSLYGLPRGLNDEFTEKDKNYEKWLESGEPMDFFNH